MTTTQTQNQSTNSINILPWLVVGVLAFFLWMNSGKTQTVEPATPSAPSAVDPVADKFKALAANVDPSVANRFAAFQGAVADVFSRVEPNALRTGQFRAWMGSSEALYIGGSDLRGALPGYSDAANEAFKSALGDEDVLIDADKKQKLVATAKSIQQGLRR